jgi:hypothetical protein
LPLYFFQGDNMHYPDDDTVDGFSDVQNQQQEGEHRDPHDEIPGSPDPGAAEGARQPFDADERARLEQEIRASENEDGNEAASTSARSQNEDE